MEKNYNLYENSILWFFWCTRLKQKRKRKTKETGKKRATLSNKKFQLHHFEEDSKDLLEESRDKVTQSLMRHQTWPKSPHIDSLPGECDSSQHFFMLQ